MAIYNMDEKTIDVFSYFVDGKGKGYDKKYCDAHNISANEYESIVEDLYNQGYLKIDYEWSKHGITFRDYSWSGKTT